MRFRKLGIASGKILLCVLLVIILESSIGTKFEVSRQCKVSSSFVDSRKVNLGHKRNPKIKRYGAVMKTKIGIVGLPNVGKSTLFNALSQQSLAHASNYPFCTIEPNIAQIPVPDANLEALGGIAKSLRTVPATLEFVDVAGLVKGASKGEGLGNRFLGTIRECSAIVHVVRCFDDPNIAHVDGRVDPVEDVEVVNLELVLADLAHIERRLERTNCVGEEKETLRALHAWLCKGNLARTLDLPDAAKKSIKSMGLLTLKPVIYACNVAENDISQGGNEGSKQIESAYGQESKESSDPIVVVSAQLESELAELDKHEQLEFLSALDILPSKMEDILSCYSLPRRVCSVLGLQTIYTGPGVEPTRSRTTRAHLVRAGLTAREFAGRIHGDFQRGFIRAEKINCKILLGFSSYKDAKESGYISVEGKDYLIENQDVLLIKWNV